MAAEWRSKLGWQTTAICGANAAVFAKAAPPRTSSFLTISGAVKVPSSGDDTDGLHDSQSSALKRNLEVQTCIRDTIRFPTSTVGYVSYPAGFSMDLMDVPRFGAPHDPHRGAKRFKASGTSLRITKQQSLILYCKVT